MLQGQTTRNMKYHHRYASRSSRQVGPSVCTRCISLNRMLVGADLTIANSKGDTALHSAARRGNLRIVQTLLEYNAPVGAQDCDQLTPLMIAMQMLNANSNSQDTRQRIVEALIVSSTSINAVDMQGNTALVIALCCCDESAWKNKHIFPASLCIRMIEAGQKCHSH